VNIRDENPPKGMAERSGKTVKAKKIKGSERK